MIFTDYFNYRKKAIELQEFSEFVSKELNERNNKRVYDVAVKIIDLLITAIVINRKM